MLEMLVVVAIVLAMTAIVIMYIPQFRDRSSLDLVAQEVAISIRGAQVYASGGKVGQSFDIGKPSYGVHFDSANPNEFFVFENNGEKYFEDETTDKIIPGEKFTLRGVKILSWCVVVGASCDPVAADKIDIVYTRPRLEAVICLEQECDIGNTDANEIHIILQAVKSERKKGIRIRSNGQIGVFNITDQ